MSNRIFNLLCPNGQSANAENIISIKEFSKYPFCSPKFFPTEKTFLNANIMFNKLKMLPSDSK